MANEKISDLSADLPIVSGDLLITSRGASSNPSITMANLKTFLDFLEGIASATPNGIVVFSGSGGNAIKDGIGTLDPATEKLIIKILAITNATAVASGITLKSGSSVGTVTYLDTDAALALSTAKVGDSVQLHADNIIANLILSGALGAELTEAQGDLEFKRDFKQGVGGVDKAWTQTIQPLAMTAVTAARGTLTTVDGRYDTLDFDDTTDEFAGITLDLGNDYDGSAITIKFWWTAAVNTGVCRWFIRGAVLGQDDPMGFTGQAGTLNETVSGTVNAANESVISTVPSGSGTLLNVQLFRNASSGSDTMVGDARIFAMSISYS